MNIDLPPGEESAPHESTSVREVPEPIQLIMPVDDEPELVPLSELWQAVSNSRYYHIDSSGDLFQDLKDPLTSDEHLFPMSAMWSTTTLCDDMPIADDAASDFGIDLPAAGWCLSSMPMYMNELTYHLL